jgi:N-acetylmuramoyl-L-alanine amidase
MKTIVLDAGHGGYDYGAVNGTRYEKTDNLNLALRVAALLRAQGQNVVMTRDTDVFIPLPERSYLSNAQNTGMFVSFHRNAYTNPDAGGVEIFVQQNSPALDVSSKYAQNVLNALLNVGIQTDRGVKQNNFSVLRNTAAPAMLIELGFISNPTDNLMYDKYIEQYAEAIAKAIVSSLGETWTESPAAGGSEGVGRIQENLNTYYGGGLTVDGRYGPATKKALIRALQTELNRNYGASLTVDGLFGPRTKAAIPNVRAGMKSNLVYLLQALLYVHGYAVAMDGSFGSETGNAVRRFQSANGLSADGIAGSNTFAALLAG